MNRVSGWVSGWVSVTARSMAALWLVGFEDEPQRCGEICVVEIFGKTVRGSGSGPVTCQVGMGLHKFRDPDLAEDWDDPRLSLDPAEMHTYAVDWDAREAVYSVDGQVVRRTPRPPAYPVQIMVAVFDFPDWATGDPAVDEHVPSMSIDWVAT